MTWSASLEAIFGDRSATSLPLLARSTDVFQLRSHSEEDSLRVFSDVLLGYVLWFVSHWEEVTEFGSPVLLIDI